MCDGVGTSGRTQQKEPQTPGRADATGQERIDGSERINGSGSEQVGFQPTGTDF